MTSRFFESENCRVTVQLPGDRKVASEGEREELMNKFRRVIEELSDILDREDVQN